MASKHDPFLVAVLAPVPAAAQPRHALVATLEDEARHARQLALVAGAPRVWKERLIRQLERRNAA